MEVEAKVKVMELGTYCREIAATTSSTRRVWLTVVVLNMRDDAM